MHVTKSTFYIFLVSILLIIPEVAHTQIEGTYTFQCDQADTSYLVNIGTKLPTLLARWTASTVDTTWDPRTRYVVELRLKSDASLFQSIVDTATRQISPCVEFVDINLDGVLDIRIHDNTYMSLDEVYHFWIFNKKKHLFVYSLEFSELSGDLYVDSLKRTITQICRTHMSPPCEDKTTYSLVTHHLKVIEHIWDEYHLDNAGRSMIKTYTQRLVKGKLRTVDVSERYFPD